MLRERYEGPQDKVGAIIHACCLDAINVDVRGTQVETAARVLQKRGFAVGAVSSVPVSHATPACSYANNVTRDDYRSDLKEIKEMLGKIFDRLDNKADK